MHVISAGRCSSERARIEAFIRDTYASHYDARIEQFAPLLLAVVARGKIRCAAGLRFEADGFFCETYLDQTAEAAIEARIGRSVRRAAMFEVTSLSSVEPASLLHFVREIGRRGAATGHEWSIFTATARLRRLLTHIGLQPLALAPARAERIPDPAVWGRYYATDPAVVAVNRSALVTHDEKRRIDACDPAIAPAMPLVGARQAARSRRLGAL